MYAECVQEYSQFYRLSSAVKTNHIDIRTNKRGRDRQSLTVDHLTMIRDRNFVETPYDCDELTPKFIQ